MELAQHARKDNANGIPKEPGPLGQSEQAHNVEEQDDESPQGEKLAPTDENDSGNDMHPTKTNASISEGMSPLNEFLFVSLICLAQFTTQVALGQTLAILHVIGDYFGLTNPGDLSWVKLFYRRTRRSNSADWA